MLLRLKRCGQLMFTKSVLKWILVSASLLSAPAHADWHMASSDHFVIYADDSAKDLAKFAEMLERYHAAMAHVTNKSSAAPSPSNRVTIFAVGSVRDLQELAGGNSRYLQGFYLPRAGASRAFVQDVRPNGRNPDGSLRVLLHEYAHHYLISTNSFAMPRWLSEGSAEFFASATFEDNGRVMIGRPALHRGYELAYADDVAVRELFDAGLYDAKKRTRYDAFYGRSWLLYHYLVFSEERAGQFGQYWLQLIQGTPSLEAAELAFGDLDVLEKDLDKYLRSRRMTAFNIPGELLPIGKVTVSKLSEGKAAMMPVIIRSQRGVNDETAQELLPEARRIAALFPDDADVLAALAEAEYDAGNDSEAIAAADRALAIDPATKNALVQKGYALFRKAVDESDRTAAYEAAMKPFLALNKLETDHPLPLIYFHRSLAEQGIPLTESARHALERAAELAPFDQSLKFNAALMQAEEGKVQIARQTLAPVAFDPHGSSLARQAGRLMAALEDAPEGTPFDAYGFLARTATVEELTGEDPGAAVPGEI